MPYYYKSKALGLGLDLLLGSRCFEIIIRSQFFIKADEEVNCYKRQTKSQIKQFEKSHPLIITHQIYSRTNALQT